MIFLLYLHYFIWAGGGAMFIVAARRLNRTREELIRARDAAWDRELQFIDMIITAHDAVSESLSKKQEKP
jgi:hypothetical protein